MELIVKLQNMMVMFPDGYNVEVCVKCMIFKSVLVLIHVGKWSVEEPEEQSLASDLAIVLKVSSIYIHAPSFHRNLFNGFIQIGTCNVKGRRKVPLILFALDESKI